MCTYLTNKQMCAYRLLNKCELTLPINKSELTLPHNKCEFILPLNECDITLPINIFHNINEYINVSLQLPQKEKKTKQM